MVISRRIPYEENHRTRNEILEKKCYSCNEWFPCTDEYFYQNKSSKSDGLHPTCKNCERERSRNYAHEHKAERAEFFKDYYAENRDRYLTLMKKWRVDNQEHKQDYQSEYLKEHKDKVSCYNQNRKHKNHIISKGEWDSCLDYFNHSCAYCGISEDVAVTSQGQRLHKEHVEHNGANDLSNCVPSCRSCNSKKWTYSLDEWYDENNPAYSEDRFNKIIEWLNQF